MKRLFLLSSLISVIAGCNLIRAQGVLQPIWQLVRGGSASDVSWGIDVDSSGNVYWATSQSTPGSLMDIILFKLSSGGEVIWRSRWSGSGNDIAYVCTVKEPIVYVGGATRSNGAQPSTDMVAIAFDAHNGSILWDFIYDQAHGYEEVDGLCVDDEAIYLSGFTTGADGRLDLGLVKLTLEGDSIWTRQWGTPLDDFGNGLMVQDSENFYVAGTIGYDSATQQLGDAFLTAFRKSDGECVWSREWGTPGNWYDTALGLNGDEEHLYSVGETHGYGFDSAIFLLQYDYYGNLQWERIWDGPGNELARSVAVSEDGYIYVCGNTDSYGAGQNDVVLLKYQPDGAFLGYSTCGGPKNDLAHGLALCGDYAYVVGEIWRVWILDNNAFIFKAELPNERTFSISGREQVRLTVDYLECYPEPFNSAMTFNLKLAQAGMTKLQVFDLLGREVVTLLDGWVPAGERQLSLNSANWQTGLYFARLQRAERTVIRKLALMK